MLRPPQRDSPREAEARELRVRAQSALAEGRAAEAEADARSVMAAYAGSGHTHEPYLTAWRILVNALTQGGKHGEAVAELTGFIDVVSEAAGSESALATMLRVNRAGQLAYLGRFDEAEADCRAAIEQCKMEPPGKGVDHYRFSAVNNLLFVQNGRGLHAEAESAARQSIREAESASLCEHALPMLHRCLAVSLNGQGRYTDAEALLSALRPDSPDDVVSVGTHLAAAQLGLGDLDRAESGARAAAEAGACLLGPAHNLTLSAGTLLGTVLARQGRLDEARRQLHDNAVAWAEHFGDAHPETVAARAELARLNG
jgi:tetratricopeptide (TPR) repeat protein